MNRTSSLSRQKKSQGADHVLTLGKSIPETILRLSAPAILEQFLICLASLIDTAMVGSIGAAATASVAINISTVWLINGFITALSVGFSFLVSHSVGEGNQQKTESVVRQSITASILLGLVLTTAVLSIHRILPKLLGAAPDVLPNAQLYLGILGIGLVPQTLGVVLSAVLRSAG
ncbi:MAG: MATE family efflux transporter, partial [Lachnospiraceae bacterium]|nr:MATE family efflux transporter [Lachnospiraceae bacterium]